MANELTEVQFAKVDVDANEVSYCGLQLWFLLFFIQSLSWSLPTSTYTYLVCNF